MLCEVIGEPIKQSAASSREPIKFAVKRLLHNILNIEHVELHTGQWARRKRNVVSLAYCAAIAVVSYLRRGGRQGFSFPQLINFVHHASKPSASTPHQSLNLQCFSPEVGAAGPPACVALAAKPSNGPGHGTASEGIWLYGFRRRF